MVKGKGKEVVQEKWELQNDTEGNEDGKSLNFTLDDENFVYSDLLEAVRDDLTGSFINNERVTHSPFPEATDSSPPQLSWFSEYSFKVEKAGISAMVQKDNGYFLAVRPNCYTEAWYCLCRHLAKILPGGVYIGFGENYTQMGDLRHTSVGYQPLADAISFLDKPDLHKVKNAKELKHLKRNISNVIVNVLEAARNTNFGLLVQSAFLEGRTMPLSEEDRVLIKYWGTLSEFRLKFLHCLGFRSVINGVAVHPVGSVALILSSMLTQIEDNANSISQVDEIMEELITTIRRLNKYPELQYMAMMDMRAMNHEFFYKLLIDHVEELMKIVYTPTVGYACEIYGSSFRHSQCLCISLSEKGKVGNKLESWPAKNIQVLVVTDGERVFIDGERELGGVKDLGRHGMGIPVGKLSLCTAHGGIPPSACLPICIDVGTNTFELSSNPLYAGIPQPRDNGQAYEQLLKEFMTEVEKQYGETVIIQFEGFSHTNTINLLREYRSSHRVLIDGIQGTACMVLAGLLGVQQFEGYNLAEQTFLFLGAGEDSAIIAELIACQISQANKKPVEEARKKMWLWDNKGLVVESRSKQLSGPLNYFKKPWAHSYKTFKGTEKFSDAVTELKPTVLVVSPRMKTTLIKMAVEAMTKNFNKPVVVTLAQCGVDEVTSWNKDAICLCKSMFYPRLNEGGPQSGEVTNSYIFPGLCLGMTLSGIIQVNDDILIAASEALVSKLTRDDYLEGLRFPQMNKIREISAQIAFNVVAKAEKLGSVTTLEGDLGVNLEQVEKMMYNPIVKLPDNPLTQEEQPADL